MFRQPCRVSYSLVFATANAHAESVTLPKLTELRNVQISPDVYCAAELLELLSTIVGDPVGGGIHQCVGPRQK